MIKTVFFHTTKKSEDGFHLETTFGPFETAEEVYRLLAHIAAFPYIDKAQDPPPTLGINVSETINAADKFG